MIPDATARGLAIEAGDVDFLPTAALPPLTEVQRLRNSSGVTVQDYKTARISQGQTIMFNLRRPEVGKLEVGGDRDLSKMVLVADHARLRIHDGRTAQRPVV